VKSRRVLALALIVVGALLLWFAPESPGGIVLLVLGLGIEVVGILLERRR